MAEERPIASLSLDLDNEWAYLKTHGDPAWESYPSYLDLVVPRILEMLQRHGLQITVFVVGQDASIESNHGALRKIAEAGHEIGSHSMQHNPWLNRYSDDELEHEIAEAEHHIELATGRRPVGFRGPGFSLSPETLHILTQRGYEYDASVFPSFIGPVARAYYLATGRFDKQERERLNQLFGGWREGLRPLRPFRWKVSEQTLVEIPVTTFPVLRIPIHLTYIMYLAGISPWLARTYFGAALRCCRLARVEPSILLHPLDFLGRQDVPRLGFFPSMGLDADFKLQVLEDCLAVFERLFDIRTVGQHASATQRRRQLAVLEPNFA